MVYNGKTVYNGKVKDSVYNALSVYKENRIKYGTLTLGGVTYETVILGNKEWTRQNLAFEYSGLILNPASYNVGQKQGSYYDRDKTTNYAYGILYNYNGFMGIEPFLSDGWRLPSVADFQDVNNYIYGGDNFKSQQFWITPGNGLYLNLIPAGNRAANSFGFKNSRTILMTTTLHENYGSIYDCEFYDGSFRFQNFWEWSMANCGSVRLCRDV